jgi:hypothetical protein
VLKPATIFLLVISIALLFGGTASAALSVNVNVVHDGTPIKVTHPGAHDSLSVVASSNNETLYGPQALITTKPGNGFVYDMSKATMSLNGKKAVSNTDPVYGNFFMWSDQDESWFWDISKLTGDIMGPNNTVRLLVPVTVNKTGKINTDVIYEGDILHDDTNPAPAEGSVTVLSTNSNNNGTDPDTVPMQETGVPIVLAALGLVSIVGGTIYSRYV